MAFDVITLPPLRERLEDILVLAEHFAINMARELEFELFSGFSEKAKKAMLDYSWPGNIRELKNVVERSVYRCNNPHIPVHELILDPFESPFRPKNRIKTADRIVSNPTDSQSNATNATASDISHHETVTDGFALPSFPVSLKDVSQQFEISILKRGLAHCQYNQKKTAEVLDLTYHQLRGYLKKYNLLDSTNEDE